MLEIYIDGSNHPKSNTSGWAFIAYLKNEIIKISYGEVPSIHLKNFEEYAFKQCLNYLSSLTITNCIIYTDSLTLKNNLDSENSADYFNRFDFKNYSKNYIVKWIERKYNKIADKYSRKYLAEYLKKEKEDFEKNWKNNLVYNNFKHPKIKYFYNSILKYSQGHNLRITEKNFLYKSYSKNNCLIFEIGEFRYPNKKTHIALRKLKFNSNNKSFVIEYEEVLENDFLLNVLSLIKNYCLKDQKVILCWTLKDQIFEKLCSIEKNNFNDQILKIFDDILNNCSEFILSKNLLLNKNSKKNYKIEHKKNLKTNPTNLLSKKLYHLNPQNDYLYQKDKKSILGKLLAIKIREFFSINKRKITDDEISNLKKEIMKNAIKL